MHQKNTSSQIIDLDAYRQKRNPENAVVEPEVLEDAEMAIQEISKHLLQAIRIVSARYRSRQ